MRPPEDDFTYAVAGALAMSLCSYIYLIYCHLSSILAVDSGTNLPRNQVQEAQFVPGIAGSCSVGCWVVWY
eukprot:3498805-Rhodomonas_salina.1